MNLSVQGIAGFSGRRPWWILLGWSIAFAAALGSCFTIVPDALDGEQGATVVLEYERAENLINERFGELDNAGQDVDAEKGPAITSELVLVLAAGSQPGDPVFDLKVSELGDAFAAAEIHEGVELIVGDFSDYSGQVSDDGTALLTQVDILDESSGDIAVLLEVTEDFTEDGFEVYMIGDPVSPMFLRSWQRAICRTASRSE